MDISELLTGIIIGFAFAALLLTVGARFIKRFVKSAKLIRSYWIFVAIFSLVSIAAYTLILSSNITDKNLAVSVTNQASALIFAIFTGYFAFSQVMEGRFEKLAAEGLQHTKNTDYTEATKAWELALTIKRKDYSVLANLIEAYIFESKYAKAEEEIVRLEKLVPPEKEEIAPILSAIMNLYRNNIGGANDAIASAVEIIKTRSRRTYYPKWDFAEALKCPKYDALTGESKTLFDNFSKYVNGQLSDEVRVRFESGDYLLANN